ncbi:MAG: hypothetical protein D6784_10215, partial [Chloroflexi bacterium]
MRRPKLPGQPTAQFILLVIVLLFAAALRFYNLNWDGGIFAHPDERSTVAFYAPTIRWPDNPDDLLDPRRSPLNPFWDTASQTRRSYTYGHFPLYTLVLVAHFLHQLLPLVQALPLDVPRLIQFLSTVETAHGYALTGRALMALADVGTVYLLFLLGRRIYGPWAGLLAAALAAVTVLQVQLAHFFAVDPVSTTFTLLALYAALLMVSRRTFSSAVVCGIGVGLAVASKFSALPVAFAPVAAVWLAVQQADPPERGAMLNRMAGLAVAALAVAFAVFAVTSPFVLLDFANFKQAVLVEQGNMVRGIADFPFTRQYRNTPAYWYFIEQQIRWGMGWPLGLLGFSGLLWVAGKAVLGRARPGEWLALGWIVLYFGPTGLFLAKFMRYMVPVVPLLTLFGAGLLAALWQVNLTGRLARLPRLLAGGLAAGVLVGSTVWALAFVNGVYGTEHPWITFSRWIYAHVPDGACLAWEHWDDRLPVSLPEPRANPEAHRYVQPQLPLYDDDTPQKYQLLRDTLTHCDYVILATNRLWRTIPRLPERYPMTTRYYQLLFSGDLGFEPVYSVETPPRLGPWTFPDQEADESFTVYDHPKPILFQKTRQLSQAEWDALLGGSWEGAVHGYTGRPTLLMRLFGRSQTPPPASSPESRESGKSLLLDTPVDQLPVVDDFRWNRAAGQSTGLAILVWWLAVTVLGLAAWPLTFALFSRLPDRGYGLSRSLGWLLVGYFVWLNSSLGGLENRLSTVLVGLGLLVLFGGWAAWRQRTALARFWQTRRRVILVSEAVFGLVFLFFVYLRILNPDLWHPWLGGEKMLEIGFLHAVVKSARMPPYDPFFAGGIINYYYYGLFLVGVLVKLTGIQPTVAFNLAVPTIAGLTAVNVFSLAVGLAAAGIPFRRLCRRGNAAPPTRPLSAMAQVSGLLAVLFVVFIGNLEGMAQLLRELGRLYPGEFTSAVPGLQTLVRAVGGLVEAVRGTPLPTYNYWDPTRVIPQTINEFPYFSFLFADLHPHMIGLPFTVLFLSLLYQFSIDSLAHRPVGSLNIGPLAHWLIDSLKIGALPFVLGAIAIINTWDLPTYLGFAVAAVLLTRYRRLESPPDAAALVWLAVQGVVVGAGLLATAWLMYAPFFAHYQAIDVGLGLVRDKTDWLQHLKIWGFFVLILVTWVGVSLAYPATRQPALRLVSLGIRRWNVLPHLVELYRGLAPSRPADPPVLVWAGLGWLVAVILLALLGYWVPAYLLLLVGLSLPVLLRQDAPADSAFLGLLVFTGFLVLLGVEFFFLRDFLGGGDYYRMNTLFKFYIQVWVMFGLAAGVALVQLWEWAWRWPVGVQVLWRGAVVVLLVSVLVYPILGTRTRVDDRFPGDTNRPPIGTLDGLAYMTVGRFEWPAGQPIDLRYDYEAIRWLQENVTGTPVIAEAKVGYYREGGMRVAAYTGLPSVLGGLHQNEQRYGWQIGERDGLVNQFWTLPDPNFTLALMDQLGITYVYVGQLERITYGQSVANKFEQLR